MLLAAAGTCLDLLVAAATNTDPAHEDAAGALPAPRRQKRDWIWNQMHVDEEKNSSLPYYVGKVGLRPRAGGPRDGGGTGGDRHCGGRRPGGDSSAEGMARAVEMTEGVNVVGVMVVMTTVGVRRRRRKVVMMVMMVIGKRGAGGGGVIGKVMVTVVVMWWQPW